MKDFLKNPPSINELLIWKRNPSINPRNNKSLLLKNGNFNKAHNYLKEMYENTFKNGYDILDSIDERDPISLNDFYKKDNKTNEFKFVYPNIENLVMYEEIDDKKNKKIRCFEKDSLSYLKHYKIFNHPVSKLKIPDHVFDQILEKVIDKSILTVKERALQVFQIFSKLSIFINYELFLKLNRRDLLKLNFEIRDFYKENFSQEDRNQIENDFHEKNNLIDNQNRKIFFEFTNDDLSSQDIQYIQYYLLNQIELLIDCKIENLKNMANYIALGALSLVIDEVKETYENFVFNFIV